ncbi:MAG: hypothetical protein SGILL_003704 [Bacillariaceae sp.]
MSSGTASRRGADGTATSSSTSASIENARRFLYDEDEVPAPANTPLPHGGSTAFPPFPTPRTGGTSGTNLSKGNNKRMNPVTAACMSTLTTCRGHGSKRTMLLMGGVALLLVSIWGITAAVGGKSDEESVKPHRVKDIHAKILELGLTSQETLEAPGTPQYHAVQWLANVDKQKLRASDPYLMQRYVLAVVFYSTAGTEDHVAPVGNWKDQTAWMTSAGFCSWHGVECALDPQGPVFDGNGVVTSLDLNHNGLAGFLPSEIGGLDGLLKLDLSVNELSGTLSKSLGNLSKLLDLILRENAFTGVLPSEFGLQFGSLRQLSLGENQLKGNVPSEIQHMTNLIELGLANNQFNGRVPDLRDLQKLNGLWLEGNNLDGPFPESITQLTSLVELNLSSNHITGMLPTSLDKLTALEKLMLNDMNLRGSIPEEIFQKTTRLTQITLNNNDLTGDIPTTIGMLKDAKAFLLENNKLGGTIPQQMGLMADIRWFHISGNKVGGSIPDLITTMKDLAQLKLGNNAITGVIPSDIGNLRRLEILDLETNKLNGNIPTELGHLKYLKEMRLYQNSLTGSMPDEVCELAKEEELKYLGADCTVKCDCCTKCF